MYLQSVTEVLVFCLLLLSGCDFIRLCSGSDAESQSFEAFRLIQFDNNREPFGSRKTKVEHLMSPLIGHHDLGRNIAVVRMQDLAIESLYSLHVASKKKKKSPIKRRAQGLLVVLPAHFDTKNISTEFATHFKAIEEYFLTHALDVAVYFTLNDNEVVERLLKNVDLSLAHQSYDRVFHLDDQWLVTGDEPTEIISNIQYTNLFGIIKPANQFIFS
ncbi:hypothetical protein RFI_25447 [Reticulomyxa filosa]|uniref:Hexosyltransferase n=1 Tax=Reticulomyxa filosa TaxID=46433 RepID=X6ME65_RETFI|nr:hypothetical protein RFI_25447 [Reticulomyxa filosa]|eukprot:ETO11931.1 hypothetical protein RFI_25447 [Reticulomyxa filosa]